jgi:cell division protein FtsL
MNDGKKKIIYGFFYFLLAILIFSSAVLVYPVYRQFQKRKMNIALLQEQAAMKTAECVRLNKEVYALENSPVAVEKVAREKFGLCAEGESVMRYDKSSTKK